MKRIFSILFFTFLLNSFQLSLLAQSSYKKGWDALNNADFDKAVSYFENALNDKATKEKAQIVLTLLYSAIDEPTKASKLFNDFYDKNPDPFSELYSLWLEEGVVGGPKKHKTHQFELLKKIETDPRAKVKFEAILKYRLISHYIFSNNQQKFIEYSNQIDALNNWAMLGPFDNVMNSGFNKDFGAVKFIDNQHIFKSKFGADIKWFKPHLGTAIGYNIKNLNFLGSNSLIYAQTFVESDIERDIILKFGYSGSLKLWLNDSLAYSELNHRETEIDYFQIKCHLNKGFNRLLVQLGDYNEPYPNFTIRLTDLEENSLRLSTTDQVQSYQKNRKPFFKIPFYAIENLQNKINKNPDDILYQILLAKVYSRAGDLDAAEEILSRLYEKFPKNYLILRHLNLFYMKSENTTNQNLIYESLKENYPNDFNILQNQFTEAVNKKDKDKVKVLVDLIKSKYPSDYKNKLFDLTLYGLDEDVDQIIKSLDEFYQKYPDDYAAITGKYKIIKALNNDPNQAIKLLEDYLKGNYNFTLIETLATEFIQQGKIDEAIQVMKKAKELTPQELDIDRKIVNLLTRKRDYDNAIEICKSIMANRPSDYGTLSDLGILCKLKGDKVKAIEYYQEAIRFFPFSFEFNEKIRELKEIKNPYDLKDEINPSDLIIDYEQNFKSKSKKPFDVVIDNKTTVIYKSKAVGTRIVYMVKINQESAIEEWQKVSTAPNANMYSIVNQAKTIKKNGNKIDAERTDDEAVFTNLEVGDYIFVDIAQFQNDGGKSSMFFSEDYLLNSTIPCYKLNYSLFVEEGLSIRDTVVNGRLKPTITNIYGFKKYEWSVVNPETIKEENNTPPLTDIAPVVHVSITDSWDEIGLWYSDLSEQQAQPDYTIKNIVTELFEGKTYTEEQKARIVYDFVCKNIQYSSIDFRQSARIPQKASDVYHTRLGDCKDVSTLYASIARLAGLDVNLVLINTRNNGQKATVLPSLNFNHCIVKVNLKSGSKYLELTDSDLPFGYLAYYHNEASILEIPTLNSSKNTNLTSLQLNRGFESKIIRNAEIKIHQNNSITGRMDVVNTGIEASNTYKLYRDSEEEKAIDDLKKNISTVYKSNIKINSLKFPKLASRADSTQYIYDFMVENEVSKVGSFKTLKIPFSDVIAKLNIFEESERTNIFDYNNYEPLDYYEENITVNLESPYKIIELPEKVILNFKGNQYNLSFEKVNDQKIIVKRTYKVERKNIEVKDFLEFKSFISKVIEGESSTLVFK